jgi:hypothetical protein
MSSEYDIEIPIGEVGPRHEGLRRDYEEATGLDRAGHPNNCGCDDCEEYWERSKFANLSTAEIDRINREERAYRERIARESASHGFAPVGRTALDDQIQEMLREQAAILDGTANLCGGCGQPLPTDEKRRGRPMKFHSSCKEAAKKRRQRGSPVLRIPRPVEKVPYVIPGYVGRHRPKGSASAEQFRRDYQGDGY